MEDTMEMSIKIGNKYLQEITAAISTGRRNKHMNLTEFDFMFTDKPYYFDAISIMGKVGIVTDAMRWKDIQQEIIILEPK
jgi:hypothetical protein